MALLVADRIERPAALFGHGEVGGGPTLDDALVRAWEGLVAHAAASCLLCGGAVHPCSDGRGAMDAGGRCERCGTTLA
jgi:hypothetical protein